VRLLSHPFRLLPNGEVATVDQGSDQANAEQLAVLCLTEIGERPMAPGFGITDPAFVVLDPSQVAAGIQTYGPDVTLSDVRIQYESEATQLVEIDFS
jgi:phage baseplate assembly protein W